MGALGIMISALCLLPIGFEDHTEVLEDAVMKFTGASSLEDVDKEELERLEYMFRYPVHINKAPISMLQECGLFTSFQASSIIDYRRRHGEIVSMMELAAVDGFDSSVVELLAPFISIRTDGGKEKHGRKFAGDCSVRGGYRWGEENMWNYGMKCRVSYSDRISLSLSGTRPNDASGAYPSLFSGNMVWRHPKGKVVLGDFNARFGQGLCMWNTSILGGRTSPSSFMLRPSGLSGTYSFAGASALTGIAADCILGRWKVSSALGTSGLKTIRLKPEKFFMMPVLNVMRMGQHGHLSLTHHVSFSDVVGGDFRIPVMKSSADVALCIRGVNVFSEVAVDWVELVPAFTAGVDFHADEYWRIASLARYDMFSKEHGISLSGEYRRESHELVLFADGLYHAESKVKDGRDCMQLKIQVLWNWNISELFVVKLRAVERLRTWGMTSRTDIRADVCFKNGNWGVSTRLNILSGDAVSVLGYAEGSYGNGISSIFLRYGMFCIDEWDDRIYVYERDAPGSFNVPAYYGRGVWCAAYLSWKLTDRIKLYARASVVSYPFMDGKEKKPGRAELKLQTVFRL